MLNKIGTITLSLLIISGSSRSYAAEASSSGAYPAGISFFNLGEDIDMSFYRDLFPGAILQIKDRYDPSAFAAPLSPGLNIYAYLQSLPKSGPLMLRSDSLDSLNAPYSLQFELSSGYNLSGRHEEAARIIAETFRATRAESIQEAFSAYIALSDTPKNLRPILSGPDGSSIDGYEWEHGIKRSACYRAVRTSVEISLGIGLGIGHYFYYSHLNKDDWVYDYTLDDAWRKIKDGWYWDPNNFNTNTIYHMYAGMNYYQIARSNQYGIFESFAWSFGGSLLWEYVGEWREQVSANDAIFTPALGSVIGEALIQTSAYIEKTMKPGVFREALCLVLYPFGWLNKKIDAADTGNFKVRLYFNHPLQSQIQDEFSRRLK